MGEDFDAVLPYAGTSGHSGSETSRQRALTADTSGVTGKRQKQLLALVESAGQYGVTVAEARKELPNLHHGQISGPLCNLHAAGLIERSTIIRREGCEAYISAWWAAGHDPALLAPRPAGRKRAAKASSGDVERFVAFLREWVLDEDEAGFNRAEYEPDAWKDAVRALVDTAHVGG